MAAAATARDLELPTFASCNQGDFVQQLGRYLELHSHDRAKVSGTFSNLFIGTWKVWFIFREPSTESGVGSSARFSGHHALKCGVRRRP